MILNRPSNLWLGAAVAVFNVVVLILVASGVAVPPDLITGVNVALGAVIALIAGQPPIVNTDSSVTVKTANGTTDKKITFNEHGFATTTSIDNKK